MNKLNRQLTTLCFLTSICIAPLAQADVVDDIEQLLNQDRAAQAHALALQHLIEHEGEPRFDFAYALSALAVGKPQLAVFALERVLLARPADHRARVELGRAHYMQGNWKAARLEFERVMATDPPANVQVRIRRFVDKIDEQQRRLSTRYQVKINLAAGYDSNINAATSDNTINIPALGVVTLGPGSVETDAAFSELAVNAAMLHRVDKYSGFRISTGVNARVNEGTDDFDTASVGVLGKYIYAKGNNRFEFPVQYQRLSLDDDPYRKLLSVGMVWTRSLSREERWGAFGQGGVTRYDINAERGVDFAIAGLLWTRQLGRDDRLFSLSGFIGNDEATQQLGAHYARRYYGVRSGVDWGLTKKQAVYGVLAVQRAQHQSTDPVFAVKRNDRYVQLVFGWRRQLNKHWQLKAQVDVTDNDSNVPIYDYDRQQFQLGVQYQSE